jgi:hypothetical protein
LKNGRNSFFDFLFALRKERPLNVREAKNYLKKFKKPIDKADELWYNMSVNEAEPPLSPSRDRGEIWLITRKSTGS